VVAELGGRSLDVHTFGLDEREALIEHLRETLRPGDIVLLKGSRGLEMENIVAALRTDTRSDVDDPPAPLAPENQA
jgi:UDP-N-acetylmuramyl pentapeptide synthase